MAARRRQPDFHGLPVVDVSGNCAKRKSTNARDFGLPDGDRRVEEAGSRVVIP